VVIIFDKAAQNTGGLPKSGWYGQTKFDNVTNGIAQETFTHVASKVVQKINVLSYLEHRECSFCAKLQACL
jgi:hypothetical protein